MGLHRPYIRASVREEVESNAQKDQYGRFLDANTGKPIEGQYDLGHKSGHEFWREAKKAEAAGMTQDEFNDKMNDAKYYQIEDKHENRSHAHEQPREDVQEQEDEISM